MNVRSSAALALILFLPALACSGSSDNKGPGPVGGGGTVGGGGNGGGINLGGGAGGAAGGNMGGGGLVIGGGGKGGATGSGGSTGAGGSAGTGAPQLKFCNALVLDMNQSIRLTLQVGTPPVALTADSGNCSTAVGTACKTITPGMNAIHLVDDTGAEVASGMATFSAGEQWILLATIDDMTMEPTVTGGVLKPEYMCSTINPFMSTGGGGPGLGGAGGMP